MRDDVIEEKLEFTQEVCRKYNRTKILAEEVEASWRQNFEMVAESEYPGEKEMYEWQTEENLVKYKAVREWLKLIDRAAFHVKSSKAQSVVRQHCLNGIPLKAVEFENGKHLKQQLREGKYKPNPVQRIEIPKETKGKYRKIGVPTVVDRVFQQAITQVLSPIFEKQFSKNSYGFRHCKGTHDALKQCQTNVNDGYVYVVDMDLEKFFDTVCQSKLIEVLSQTIKDGRVVSLIHKYLNASVISKGIVEKTEVGMSQGGSLSPLLSNIMLNKLDKELSSRGHRYVLYADDCMIFCKSRKSAERTLENIVPFIKRKLFLKVNRTKTCVVQSAKSNTLGIVFTDTRGNADLEYIQNPLRK